MKILIDWIRNSHSLGFAPVSDFSPQELGPFLRFNEDIVGHFPNAPGIPRSTAVYLAAIRSCGRSAWRRAIALLDDIHGERMEQGMISHKAVLKVLEHAERWQEVLALLRSMQTRGPTPGLEEYSLALRVCGNKSRNSKITEALRANLDAFIYQDQLESCRQDEWQLVLRLIEGMAQRDLFPDKVACSSAIHILERSFRWVEALQLVAKSQRRGHSPDGALYGAIIRCCLRNDGLEEAITLMEEAIETDLRPDMETYEALVLACSSTGGWQWALFFWRDMLRTQEGQQTAFVVHESLLEACKAAGEWKWVLALLSDMEKVSLQPSVKGYQVALLACQQAKQWDWVDQLEQKLVSLEKATSKMFANRQSTSVADGEPPDLLGSLQGCADGSWEAALQLLRTLQGRKSQPDGIAFNSVIDACRRGGEIDKAIVLMEEMQEAKFDPDSKIYNEVVNALQPGQAKETPAAIRQSWSMTPGSFKIIRTPKPKRSALKWRGEAGRGSGRSPKK
ncbi:unnamed protein product [Cladocopium goreaui]|uniref:Pentacotripeptide-repeat region of PRORP domain-containing protein n=1 Tax=Cladocopium goreaui TaxID=2562237 RepID=A0A9P1CYD0_9DINO|nr:unnamed protein product [Cladocopium goreaui]